MRNIVHFVKLNLITRYERSLLFRNKGAIMMRYNRVKETLNITHPIILGGMGNISSPQLAASVSNAGGLGTIGCGTMAPDGIKRLIQEIKEKTNKPFAVNVAINVNEHVSDIMQLIIDEKVPVVSLSAGNPAPFIPTLKENGIKVMTIVASVRHAQKAKEAGADILVAEGFEAAGINSNLELTTMTLIPQITTHVDIPVVAAGGIGDGKGLAAALMLGAEGVQMGTRFIATKEAPFHDAYKTSLLQASDTATTIVGRSVGRTRRVIKGNYINSLLEKEKTRSITQEQFDELTAEDKHIQGAIHGNFQSGYINAGQVAGLIDDIPTVEQLIDSLIKDAHEQIKLVQQHIL